ncbi:hypothetical protein CO024_02040 [Candidatus Gracilibacteria bacterium CG_4_9_14_0_2_um_filter_38_7]|nr:MAG: hypothetical protein COW68_00635 [Candidatus Gracilibacteria bacterium CG18_big_fil_WC_8_21_14_2_50_38_16]PIQ41480.1 MAG: hypothetical protein COW06_02770 [Candidatus Gracilibacteria bacterium CG12_big_fil_rev_8_21_14_0_65_38_15]PIZ01786.1 MAG: hypothetical protein COY60_01715 [Candidatus Gracilibacteria bacterium CG_4_10_14_0_8_um_filter_38_28]PJC56635.1 MAG: hypothetical protein CO024_02040 [Candidatus Gracilibacteria bacterium CG_4_9_14_0_2_um_filter_38_7]
MKSSMKSFFKIIMAIVFFGHFSYAGAACNAVGECETFDGINTATISFDSSASSNGSSSSSAVGSQGSASSIQSLLQVNGGNNSANSNTNVTFKDNFLKNIQIYMIGLLGIVSVSVFLYIGYMLFTAQGKEEDFKKAWTALTYAVIGLAVMPLAYIAVKIVTGFSF